MQGTIGLDAKLPLLEDRTDLFYGLTKTAKENTKQKVKMLMLTAPGERIMIPDYGVGLRNYLFENTPEFDIEERIRSQVATYLPEIQIIDLQVNRSSNREILTTGQRNLLSVRFEYLVKGTKNTDSVILVETIQN